MRLSAKLNLFLGVRNFGEALLPDHLRYLETYFARRRMNALLPFSALAGIGACVGLVASAAAPGSDVATATGHTLLASLIALGVLEHAFMVLPVPPEALYRRVLPARPVAVPEDLHVPARGVVPRAAVPKPHGSRP
jgi:putative photosynthetic complex assembly protein 2